MQASDERDHVRRAPRDGRPWSGGANGRQAHAAAAPRADRAFRDQFDAGRMQRADQLHQRIDVAAHHAIARLHALDGRQGQAGQLGQLPLIDPAAWRGPPASAPR